MRIVYVDGFHVRNITGDMNFNLLGRNPDWDDHWYIPKSETWIEKRARKETKYLIAMDDFERRMDKQGKNLWDQRRKFSKLDAISLTSITVKKREGKNFLIRYVKGNLVRKYLDYSFIMGGHHEIYPWYIPKNEIWIDNTVDPIERKYILDHETKEFILMKKGLGYYKAHYDYACVIEKENRLKNGVAFYPRKNPIDPLSFIKIGKSKKRILITSGIHGDEPSGPYSIIKFLLNKQNLKNLNADIVPLINPTGFEIETRKNKNRKDLNRHFFDKPNGKEPNECKILKNFFGKIVRPYEFLISLHEDPEREEFYLYDTGNGKNSKMIKNIIKRVKKEKVKLWTGLDDAELGGNYVKDGYLEVNPEDKSPTLEEYLFRNKKVKKSITLEIPGKLPLDKKIELVQLILKEVLRQINKRD